MIWNDAREFSGSFETGGNIILFGKETTLPLYCCWCSVIQTYPNIMKDNKDFFFFIWKTALLDIYLFIINAFIFIAVCLVCISCRGYPQLNLNCILKIPLFFSTCVCLHLIKLILVPHQIISSVYFEFAAIFHFFFSFFFFYRGTITEAIMRF